MVIVDKKDFGKRFCVDSKAVNKNSKSDAHSLPDTDDIIASLY